MITLHFPDSFPSRVHNADTETWARWPEGWVAGSAPPPGRRRPRPPWTPPLLPVLVVLAVLLSGFFLVAYKAAHPAWQPVSVAAAQAWAPPAPWAPLTHHHHRRH